MKIQGYKVSGFINTLPTHIRGVLLYGPDRGLAKEFEKQVILKIIPDADDFAITKLLGEDVKSDSDLIAGEASQISIMGGRRLISVYDVDDKTRIGVNEFLKLEETDSFLVILAGDLKVSSLLRKLFETEKSLASLPCFQDDVNTVTSLITEKMRNDGISMEKDALNWAVANMGVDRSFTRMEIEKLVLYAGDNATLTLNDVQSCMSDAGLHKLDDIVYACASGNIPLVDSCLDASLAEDVNPIALIRITNSHFLKLHRAKLDMSLGKSIDDVSRGIFFKRKNTYNAQLRAWTSLNLVRAIKVLQDAENLLKQTGTPQFSTLSKALYTVATLSARK